MSVGVAGWFEWRVKPYCCSRVALLDSGPVGCFNLYVRYALRGVHSAYARRVNTEVPDAGAVATRRDTSFAGGELR